MIDERLHRMQVEFLEAHKDADELVVSTISKQCIKAIYYSPYEKMVAMPMRKVLAERDNPIAHTGTAVGWYRCDGKDCPICGTGLLRASK